VRPLLDILAGCGITRVDAMKMDIEGFEDQAIIPMLRSAPRSLWPKRLLIEILMKGNWREDCVAALLAAGYREIWRKDEGDALFRL